MPGSQGQQWSLIPTMHTAGFSTKLRNKDKLLQSIFTIRHVIMGNYHRGDICSIACPESLSSQKMIRRVCVHHLLISIIPILILSSIFKEIFKNSKNKIKINKELCKYDSILHRKTPVCGSPPQKDLNYLLLLETLQPQPPCGV